MFANAAGRHTDPRMARTRPRCTSIGQRAIGLEGATRQTVRALAEHLLVVHSMNGVEFRQWHWQYARRSFTALAGAK